MSEDANGAALQMPSALSSTRPLPQRPSSQRRCSADVPRPSRPSNRAPPRQSRRAPETKRSEAANGAAPQICPATGETTSVSTAKCNMIIAPKVKMSDKSGTGPQMLTDPSTTSKTTSASTLRNGMRMIAPRARGQDERSQERSRRRCPADATCSAFHSPPAFLKTTSARPRPR